MTFTTDADIVEAVRQNTSVSGVVTYLRRARVGTNFQWVRAAIHRLNLDISHWTEIRRPATPRTGTNVLVENSPVDRGTVKSIVLREHLIPYFCAECGSGPEWRGRPLVLRLDHINGVRDDNRLANLRFMCPNCDAQSPTFCGRNKQTSAAQYKPKSQPCKSCFRPCSSRTVSARCRSCATKQRLNRFKIEWPTVEELHRMVSKSNFSAVARQLGVSDQAVRKHLHNFDTVKVTEHKPAK